MTTEQIKPRRAIALPGDKVLYVSDAGVLVLASGSYALGADEKGELDEWDDHVVIEPEFAQQVAAAILALLPSAQAKEAAVHAVVDAMCEAEKQRGQS